MEGRDERGHEGLSLSAPYPLPANVRYSALALSAKGRFARRYVEAGRGRGARGPNAQFGTRAMPGLRPGPLRVPARSWLKDFDLRYGFAT